MDICILVGIAIVAGALLGIGWVLGDILVTLRTISKTLECGLIEYQLECQVEHKRES